MYEPESDLFYTSIIHSYTDGNPRFLRRKKLAQEIRNTIAKSDYQFILLTGGPLTGKSTLMAQLALDNSNWLRYFIRRDQRSPLGDPGIRSFLLQTGFQLVALHPELFKRTQIRASVETIVKRVEKSGSVIPARIKRIIASPFVQTILEIRTHVEESSGSIHGLEVGEWVDDPRLLSSADLAELALFRPARTFHKKNGGRIVILVDALDELRYHPQPESLLDWLAKLGEFPKNIRFILSSRVDEALLGDLCRAQDYRLKKTPLEEEEVTSPDVRLYATKFVAEDPLKDRLKERASNFVDQLINLAANNLGYLDLFARAIDQALIQNDESRMHALLELRGLPNTFQGLYAHFLDQVRLSVEHEVVEIETPSEFEKQYLRTWPAVIKKIFAVLSVAMQPLDTKQLVTLGDIHARSDYFQDCLLRTFQFLDTSAGRYRFFHTSLAEYLGQASLQDDPATLAFYVDTASWHRLIADYYRLHYQNDWSECDEYGLEFTLRHLLNANIPLAELEGCVKELLTVDFINARGTLSGWHRPLLQDLYLLKDKLPDVVIKPCIEILGGLHRNSLVNQEVLRLLIDVNQRDQLSSLREGSQGTKEWIVSQVLDAVTRDPTAALPVLESLMQKVDDVQMKGVIVLAMGETGQPDASVRLLDILFDTLKYAHKPRDAGHLRWCSTDALLAVKEPDIVEPLINKFQESDVSPWLQQQIIYVLGRMRADIPLEKKYHLLDIGMALRQDCLPRVLDAVYLLAPLGGSARQEWAQHYQPYILAGLGLDKLPHGTEAKPWTYQLTIKRALAVLREIGRQDAIIPLDKFMVPMIEKGKNLDDQERQLLQAARRARTELIARWGS